MEGGFLSAVPEFFGNATGRSFPSGPAGETLTPAGVVVSPLEVINLSHEMSYARYLVENRHRLLHSGIYVFIKILKFLGQWLFQKLYWLLGHHLSDDCFCCGWRGCGDAVSSVIFQVFFFCFLIVTPHLVSAIKSFQMYSLILYHFGFSCKMLFKSMY